MENVTKDLQRIDHLLGIKSHIPEYNKTSSKLFPLSRLFSQQCDPVSALLVCKYVGVRICAFKSLQVLQVEEGYKIILFFMSSVLL